MKQNSWKCWLQRRAEKAGHTSRKAKRQKRRNKTRVYNWKDLCMKLQNAQTCEVELLRASSSPQWHWSELICITLRIPLSNSEADEQWRESRDFPPTPAPTCLVRQGSVVWLTAGDSSGGECGCCSTSLAQHFHLDWADRLKPSMNPSL